ncbi:serine-rich adhesin for platelets-like isoform X2 [Narcine bancroftii]|uniref:serine-rich adhesin for platelets-like isoform X2 n=1 Tax=Narcine bancroftii TaxID=1343680 RepID=UPI003832266B
MFKRWESTSERLVDLSFLNHEEVEAILGVLDRDQEVRRMNAERLKKVKKTNPNELWLKGITGQWFEEIRKAKFKDQTDLSKLLKVPHTWSIRKKRKTALTDSKLTQSNNCPQVKNVINNTKSSGIFKVDEGVASESVGQNAEPLLEQGQCSNQKLVHLESPTMFQQLQVRLKPAPVPRVKRKVYMHYDTCKQEHPKVLGQDPETKISNVALDECEKIMSVKNVSNSELPESTKNEEYIKKYTFHDQARLCREDNKIKIDNLSGNAEVKSPLVGCNSENARLIFHVSDVLAVEQQENYCTRVDNGILSNPKSVQSSSINQPRNLLQDRLTISRHDDQAKSNSNWYLSKNKREIQRTSLFDLMFQSQVVPDLSIKQQNYLSSSHCESSQRNESDSASNSEPVPFSPMTGPRSLIVSNKNVWQQNCSGTLLNTSYKTDSCAPLQGNKSETILVTSSPALVYTSPPVISTSTNSRCHINTLSYNINPKRNNTSDSSRVSQLKPSISLSQVDPGCQPRTASRITINIRNRQHYSESSDINIATPIKCNDDYLQQFRGEKERMTLFPNSKTSSEITFTVSKTRMEFGMSRDAEAPLPGDKNDCKQNCKVEGRSTSLLPILVIGSQMSTCDKEKEVVPASESDCIDAALQINGDDYLQKAKSEMGHELSADPRSVDSSNNGAVRSQSLKSDHVNLESAINTLQSESKESNAITQSANHENQLLQNQRSPLNNDRLALDGNSIQNDKLLSINPAPKKLKLKYQLPYNSANSARVRADRPSSKYKSEPNHVPVLSLPDSTKAIPLNIKIGMNNTLQNMQSHTTSSFLTEKLSVDNMQNYISELTSAPSSSAMTPCLAAVFNVDKSSKSYPDVGHRNVAQQNKCETLPETTKEQNSTATNLQLRPVTSFCQGSKYLPKDKSETNSNLPSENSQCDQCILTKSMDNSQRRSPTNFLLDNITTASKSVDNYPSENNIPFSFQGTPTAQLSPINDLNNLDKLLFHSPAMSCTDKNLEDYHSDNYTILQPSTPFGFSASSSIKRGTKTTSQNVNDYTKMRGMAKEYKEAGNSKPDIVVFLPYSFSKPLAMTDCTYESQNCWLSNIGNTEDRKSLDCLETLKSEMNTPIMSSRVTDQVSPVNTLNNKDKQLNYLPNTVNITSVIEGHTLDDKSEMSCVSSSLDLETSQPPLLHKTWELQNFSFDSDDHISTTGFNKHLEKANIELCSTGPSTDFLKGSADIVQHLNDRISVNLGLSLNQLVVQECPPPNTDTKKNAPSHYTDEGPSDQSNAGLLSERTAATSSPTRMCTPCQTSNNNVSQHPAHPLYDNVEEGAISYLQSNKLKSHTTGKAPGVLTDTRPAASSIEINIDALQYDTSEAIQNDEQRGLFTSKQLQETNRALSSHSLINKRYPVVVENNNKDYKPFNSQFGGDIRMDRGDKEYLEKDNNELSTSDSLTDVHVTPNITGNISVDVDAERNVEYYQPEEHNVISPTALTSQRTSTTNLTAGEAKAGPNLSPNNNGITFHGRTCNNNAEGHSKAPDLSIGEQVSTYTKFIPKFSAIPKYKYATRYESLGIHSGSSPPTVDRGIRPPVSHSVTELNYSTTIRQNKILSLTQFPLNYNTTLGAESIKNIQNYQSEQKYSVPSQDGVAGQQPLSDLYDGQDKLLTCLLKSDETDENFQKDEPKINNVISPVICHQSAARVTEITKNTLQQCTKVTDIYKRKSPSNRLKLNLLKRAKCVPSLPEITGQCQTDNISLCINQEKMKYLPLRDNPNLLLSNKNFGKYQFEKYQAASSKDELNSQCTLTSITQNSNDTNLPKTDGTTLSRGFMNSCDRQDRCETKCVPSPLNPAFDQLSHADIAHRNEPKPSDQVLNFTDDAVYPKSPGNHVIKRAIFSGDKVTQQISPTSTAYSKNKPLIHSAIITDTDLRKSVNPVISHQISNSSFRNLSDSFNSDAVNAEIAVNKCTQRDAAESNKITIDSLIGLQSFRTITDINKNIGQDYSEKVFDMCDNRISCEESNHKFLRKTNSAPPQMINKCITTNFTGRNQDKPSNNSKQSDGIVMARKNNDHIQKNKPEANNQLSAYHQSLPYVDKNKQVKSLTHSPVRSSFEMNEANIKYEENRQSQNNRRASLHTPNGQKSSTETTCDLIDQEYSTNVTFNKNSKYLSKTMQSRDTTLDQRKNDNWMQTDKYLSNNRSLASDSASVLLSPKNVYNHRNYSSNSGKISPHDNHIVKEDRKILRCRQKSFPGQMVENRIAGTHLSNRHNYLQHCSLENQIGPEFKEINKLHYRPNATIDFSQNTSNKDNSMINNNNQAGTARFSKNYSRFSGSNVPKCQNTQSIYDHIFKEKCQKDVHSSCSQYSHQDQENTLSTSIKLNSKLTAQKRQVRPFNYFSSYAKRNRFYGSHPDLSFIHGNEFDENIRTSYDGNADNELTNGNKDTRDVSKEEAVKKDAYLENMKRDRLWKPEFHKKTSSSNTEDVFDPLPIDINQNPDGDTVKNDEYFPVDIKMFWPKENPTDIIRLLSSTSTGSKISEDSLSPQTHRTPAEILKQKSSCHSDTDSDTTTDDEYFLDCIEVAKESAV